VAAIDCGTNSLRLLVADLPPAGSGAALTDLSRRLELVRLGEGVDRTGRLSDAAIERTRVMLAEYAADISRLGAQRVRMVATSASRDAANADQFTAMVIDTLGVRPEVVTGQEEAQLSYAGAVRGLPAGARPPYLVVDIGGGSTEFVVGSDPDRYEAAVSVDVGCVRMTERHLVTDPPIPAEVAAAEADVTAAVDRALAAVGTPRPATLVGLAGSVTTVAAVALDLPAYLPERFHHRRISYEEVAKVAADLLGMSAGQRRALPAMHPGRADVIAAGALILRVAMAQVGAGEVLVSEHDILDGIAWSMA
jgi:exopolyphosphatase/guanosine-5'-triphosphate,3'-diphosphate pyrophosphatase